MSIQKSFEKYICGIIPHGGIYDFSNKQKCINQYITYMLNRTQSMFKWQGLPGTIPQRILELYLQINGNVIFYKHNGELYVFTGGLGGEPDEYYFPTLYTVANPALKLSKTLRINDECVLMLNDSMLTGLLPLYEKYATQMCETDLSIDIAITNTRIATMISASDDRTKVSAEKYLSDIKEGKQGVIAENAFLEGIKAQPYTGTGYTSVLTSLIEMLQYQKASWFNDLGLNANYNMKRESINSKESQLNDDALLPLVDNMLKCRKDGVEKVNQMYGTHITVEFASSWEDNIQEIELEHTEMGETKNGNENPG